MRNREDIRKKIVNECDKDVNSIDVLVQLASCIALASISQLYSDSPLGYWNAKDFHGPESHIYWEVRENVEEYARGKKIFYPNIISYYNEICNMFGREDLERLSSPVWDQVVSPTLLINNALST